MNKNIFKNLLIIGLLACPFFSNFADVRLPKLVSDGMVMQRNQPLKIWGWASPNEKISLSFKDKAYQTVADKQGSWQIVLGEFEAGGPYELLINADNHLTVKDIWIGDVWICSGQSNMELPMERVSPVYETEIASADYPLIRYFDVPQTYNFKTPQTDFAYGQWVSANPQTVLKFSAAAYFFAKELYERYQIPIGLINISLGGSPAEAWISEDSIRQFPAYYQEAQRFKDDNLIQQIQTADNRRIGEWYADLDAKDAGFHSGKRWSAEELDDSAWALMDLPGYWAKDEKDQPVNGVMWFRKKVEVPASFINRPVKLILGCIVDADSVFINGKFVGTTSYQYPPRRYSVPAGVLHEGENTVAIRVVSNAGQGGFVEDKPYQLVVGDRTIDLRGDWKYKLGARKDFLEGETFIRWKPVGLYNAMLAPLFTYPIKGVIWYQGESNASGRAIEYRNLFATLIRDWRARWKQGDFPFLFVQLANFMRSYPQPAESDWATLRESQLKTLALPNTGMAVTIDIGEWNDIHPLNKKEVGKRLALNAEKWAYGENSVVYSGPVYQSMQIDGNKIVLTFSQTGSGLTAKGGKLGAFAIAGKDKQFVWANAEIKDNQVIVWSDEVPDPVAVRYAWADNPENANLYNQEGLPASPFRTDDWGN
ncbi:9-O-acetylesterase [Bacteroidia bacterium]|nr:9-O-acetylesterase [Bacteroidia bacterium]